MRRARFAVEETAQAETAGQFPFGGQDESQVDILRGAPVMFQFLDVRDLAYRARLVLGRQFDLALVLQDDALLGIIFRV